MYNIFIRGADKALSGYGDIVTKKMKLKKSNWKVLQQPENTSVKKYSGNFRDIV
jgi:hypothetical protein